MQELVCCRATHRCRLDLRPHLLLAGSCERGVFPSRRSCLADTPLQIPERQSIELARFDRSRIIYYSRDAAPAARRAAHFLLGGRTVGNATYVPVAHLCSRGRRSTYAADPTDKEEAAHTNPLREEKGDKISCKPTRCPSVYVCGGPTIRFAVPPSPTRPDNHRVTRDSHT
jgi:hypothetical protein